MPLEPQAEALLAALRERGGPPLHTLTPAEARRAHSASTAEVGAPGEPVAEVHDLAVPGPGGDIPVRVYVPEETEGTLVFIHGGGWVVGTLDSFDGVCRALARRARMTVVSAGYRLAPEHPYPAAFEDCLAVVDWAGSGSGAPLVPPGPMVVAGDSAGGQLAASVAIRARDEGPALAAQVLVYPITDSLMSSQSMRDFAEGYYLTADGMAWYWDLYVGSARHRPRPEFSPLHADDLSGLPPALVITAGYDPLRDEGEAYARRLEDAGTPVTMRRFDGMLHGFVRFTAVFDSAGVALDEIGVFARATVAAAKA
jgi:acetyl esterase